ncbi:Rpn family recombination-promoting nuclease/putative transposase [Sporosarcina limicola]|uniref:Rpn family recombination-promoting nuclease/putative transposase n=1 Tax=Sporosarcina limicola TaxID=34101 RepID=UPI00178B63B9
MTALVWENSTDYEVGNVDQDGLWKKVIGELFEDFLLYFAPDLHAQVDFSEKAEFLQQELFQQIIKDKKGRKITDQLVKVHLKDGEEKWVLVHVEVQSDNEPDFAKRMFQYFYRIFDKYDKEIIALAIMTSPHKSEFPTEFRYTYFGTKLNYAYNTYKIVDHSYEKLEQSDKLFSKMILAIKYMHDTREDVDKRYTFKMKLMGEVIKSKHYSWPEIKAVFYFIDYLLRLPEKLSEKLYDKMTTIMQKEGNGMVQFESEGWSPTMEAIFTRIHEKGEKEGIEKGLEQGIEQGIKKNKVEFVLGMIKEGIPIATITKIAGLDEVAIKKLIETK